jgi:DNA-binding transcriptional LysR family regulator
MREIETRLFRYFVALAEEQHFGRAAFNLGISPPTLTNQIQKLEGRLGARLVERRGNTHVELTETGRRFLERARNVLRETSEAEAVARQAARGEIGRLEIGFMTVASLSGLIEKCIGGFQKQNPGIEIILRAMVTAEQINAILERTLDFGFVRAPDSYPTGIEGFIVHRQPMVIALPGDHPLASQKRIKPSSLKDQPFINTSPDLEIGYLKHTEAVGELAGFTPRVVLRAKDMVSILSCVSAGQGVAVVSQAFTRMNMPNVVYREFETDAPPVVSMAFIGRQHESSPAAKVLLKYMRSFALKR